MQIFYTVRTGDTLSNIAARWFIPLQSLIAANNLSPPYLIYPGQQLSMPPGVSTYVVRPGDSIYSISIKYGIPMDKIIQDNGIEPPYVIMPGTVLTVSEGVPFYVVRPGDTLYNIASRYNVTVNGQPRPDMIIAENPGLTPNITPGMRLLIPYPPAGGTGRIAAIIDDGINSFIQIFDPVTESRYEILVDRGDRNSRIFWSPRQDRIAYIDSRGIISVIDVSTRRIARIDQISFPAFVDWSMDGRLLVYSTGRVIRIYNVENHTFYAIRRAGASYVQWFPNGRELLFEAKDSSGLSQLYRIDADGRNERRITNNANGPLNDVRLSPNGAFVLYTTPGASISEIYIMDLATGELSKIPGGPEAKNYYPTWSPDSAKIAYSSTQFINGRYYSLIRVSDVKGERDATVAIASCYATPVTWSPDSRKIAYMSGCREDVPPVEVWSIDLERPVPISILDGFLFYDIDWAPTR